MELVAAVAAERFEQVAREEGGVEANQGGGDRLEVPHDEDDRVVSRFVIDLVADDPTAAVARRQLGLGDAMDELLAPPAVLDQCLDREDRQAELGRQFVQPLAAGAAGAVEDLADHPGRLHPGEREEVHRRLGVACPAEDAPLLGDQRMDVAGTTQVGRGASFGSRTPRMVRQRSSAVIPVRQSR